MIQSLRAVTAPLLGAGLLMVGNGLLITIVSLRVGLGDWGPGAAGVILAAYYAGLLLGALLCGRVVAAVGHIRAFSAFASLLTAVVLGHGIWQTVGAWLLLRVAVGVALAGQFIVVESWLTGRASPQSRGAVLGVYVVIVQAGFAVGQLAASRVGWQGERPFVLAAAALSLAAVPVALTRHPQPELPATERLQIRTLLARAPLAGGGAVAAGLITGSIITLAPVLALASGLSPSTAASFAAAIVLGGTALQLPAGRLSDRVGRRRVLAVAALGAAGLALVLAWKGIRAVPTSYAHAALLGGLVFTFYPLSVAHAHDLMGPELRVGVSSTLLLLWAAGASVGPVLGASLLQTGPRPLLWAWAAGCAILGALAAGRLRAPRRLTVRAGAPGALPHVAPLGTMAQAPVARRSADDRCARARQAEARPS